MDNCLILSLFSSQFVHYCVHVCEGQKWFKHFSRKFDAISYAFCPFFSFVFFSCCICQLNKMFISSASGFLSLCISLTLVFFFVVAEGIRLFVCNNTRSKWTQQPNKRLVFVFEGQMRKHRHRHELSIAHMLCKQKGKQQFKCQWL